MSRFLARITPVGGDIVLVEQLQRPTDPGYGGGRPGGADPGFDIPTFPHPGHPLPPSGGRPGQGLPVPPVRPSVPIVLPPGVWPPQLPPGVDNSLPGPGGPIFIPPDPSIGIEQPIYLPQLPAGTALLIALPPPPPGATPKAGTPAGAAPAILWQGAGTKPVLVYVSAAQPGGAQPK